MIQLLIGPIADLLGKVIDGVIPDQNERERIKAEAMREILTHGQSALEAQMNVILAEARGESWIQRSWRPILMLVIVAIVANNYLLAPYLTLMGVISIQLELPDRLFDLMTLGVGGYIAGRSVEKTARAWKERPTT